MPFSSILVATALLAAMPPDTSTAAPLSRYEAREFHMGQPIVLVLYADSDERAEAASKAVYGRIAQLDRSLSDYRPDSELSLLCERGRPNVPQPVGDDLYAVLKESVRIYDDSDHAFDVTIAPVVKLWREARRTKRLPDPAAIAEARTRVGTHRLHLDDTARTVTFDTEGMRIDLGGIGVGWMLDDVAARLIDMGINSFLIDASGDILCGDPPPGREAWRVSIQPLLENGEQPLVLNLRNRAVTTSGDAYRFVEIDGKRYSHIVDPRTGMGLVGRSSVTIVSRKAVDADAYSKAVSILGPDEGMKFVEAREILAASFVVLRNGDPLRIESVRFRPFVMRETGTPSAN